MGDDFVPEADAEEQAEPVTPDQAEPASSPTEVFVPVETPEADLLEQAAEVPDEDEDERR